MLFFKIEKINLSCFIEFGRSIARFTWVISSRYPLITIVNIDSKNDGENKKKISQKYPDLKICLMVE
jgi:hypothetical protein